MMISRALEGVGLRSRLDGQPLTTNQKIFRAIVVVGGFSLFARLASTAKELVVAQSFGRGDALDAFLIALLLPTTITGMVAGSLSAAFIPTYIHVRENQGHEAAQRLFSNIQVASLMVLAILALLMAGGAPYYLPLLASGFSASKLLLTRRLLFVILPIVVFNWAITIWGSVLQSNEKFALAALTPVITPLVSLTMLFAFRNSWGIFALATGTVAGTVLEMILLGRAVRSRGISLRLRWYGVSPEFRRVFQQYLPMFSGTLVLSTSPIIDQSMAAMLTAGSVAALSYGNKIASVMTSLGMAAVSTAVLPYFSTMIAKKDWNGCRRTLKVYSILILSATVPLMLVMIAFSRPLVRILYQRGAFTAADTALVSNVQICFALLLPFAVWSMLYVRLLSSLNRSDVLAWSSLISACLNVVLNIVFMKKLGVAGIGLSTSVVGMIACTFLGIWALRSLRQQQAAATLSFASGMEAVACDTMRKTHGI
jgi:putative peptidoglycan lipid II flippase